MYQKISEYLKTKEIFDSSLATNYDYLTSAILTALTTMINTKFGVLRMIDDTETTIKGVVNAMFVINDMKYKALFNIDKLDDPTKEFYEKRTFTGTVTNTDSGTVTTELTPSVVATTSEKKNTADNGTLKTINQIENSSTGSDTNERTDNLTFERTDDLTHEREGYNNAFSNADIILKLSNNALYDIIINDVISTITLNVYDLDDLRY